MSHADALHEKAIAAYNSGDFELAETHIRSAIDIDNQNPHAHINLANILMARGRYSAALLSLSTATGIASDISIAHYLKGVALEEMGNPNAALESTNVALALDPQSVKALLLRGNLFISLGNTPAAIADYQTAMALDDTNALTHFNLACALSNQGRLNEALVEYDAALAIFPELVQAHCNKANALRDLMQLEEAKVAYACALELDPTNHHLHWNLGLLQLQQGQFQQGWQNYECRLGDPTYASIKTSAAKWNGIDCLQGKTILVIGEQGLGDMIQFSRYIPKLHQLGAHVKLQVPNSLARLLGNLDGVVDTMSIDATPPDTDFYCMLMSLPALFKTEIDTIPFGQTAYLAPTAPRRSQWQTLLSMTQHPRVGLVTRGNPRNPRDEHRRICLDDLAQWLPPHINYFLLHDQLNTEDESVMHKHPNIQSIQQHIHDFDDTAAACLQMDLVITVDTATAHLSGALGIHTWVMIPFASDWRWLLNRHDSPWYSKMRLFRQKQPGNWSTEMQDIHLALEQFLENTPIERWKAKP